MVQPVNEEHLCLINLSIFVCDAEAGNKVPNRIHIATPEYPEASKRLFGVFFLFVCSLYTAEP